MIEIKKGRLTGWATIKRLERENAAQRKVIEAIREMFAFGPEWRVEPIKKALAELDAGETGTP